MVKSFKIPIFLIIIMIMASFPGIYAINIAQKDNNVNIGEVNNDTVGSKTIYVARNGTDRNDGLTPETPKRNIEIALEVANSGDTIRVGPGTYQINLEIDKNITLIGDNQNNTIIVGQSADSCIHIQPAVTVTIVNFTLNRQTQQINTFGGGIRNSGKLTLENLTIRNNHAEYGGGIGNDGTMSLKGVTIANNTAQYSGGGIKNTENGLLTVEDSLIINNTAQELGGGGIYNTGSGVIRRSQSQTTTQNMVEEFILIH